jgi:6-phosphogluconolactonase (cycloisomerase 2 family)
MKFTKFGKALLMGALTTGVVLSVSSCVQSYTVGFLYVTGTETAQSTGNGIISGYKIDHNTGALTSINGLPISSGGANPERAVLLVGSRFLYVLNRGTNASGGSICTTSNPCSNANITEFAVGGNGILTAQETFYTQGVNPFRLITDSSGSYLYVLDHDAPDSAALTGKNPASNSCTLALASLTSSNTCGDITVFSVNSTTGQLSLVQNTNVTATTLSYFPVPANPVDFVLAGGYVMTLSSATAQTTFPYTGGSIVFPYVYSSGTGRLSVGQDSLQPLTDGSTSANTTTGKAGLPDGTAINYGGGYLYVLDNNAITVSGTTSPSQILPYIIGTAGALSSQVGGPVADDPTQSNPSALLVESKGKWAYVANQGVSTPNEAYSGLAGYVIDSSTKQLTFLPGEPFGSGSGPRCMVEDPSNQFIYEANYNDSTISGRVIDQNSGVLNNLPKGSSFTLPGQPTWCLMDGRTD